MERDRKFLAALGNHLREIRESRKWSQTDLSAVSRVSEIQISKIENGLAAANTVTIKKLAEALGKHPSKLYDFKYDYNLNTDFSTAGKGKERIKTTGWIKRLFDADFFKQPRSVAEIVEKCEEEYRIVLVSAAVSGVMRKLIEARKIKRLNSSIPGRFLYVKR